MKKTSAHHPAQKDPAVWLPPLWTFLEIDVPDLDPACYKKGREWWKKHPLCTDFRLTPQKAMRVAHSAHVASISLTLGKLYKNSSRFYTDLAVSRFLEKDDRSTASRFLELGHMLKAAEGMRVKMIPAEKLIKKIINHIGNQTPEPIPQDNLNAWLCDHWVSGEILCVKSIPEIKELIGVYPFYIPVDAPTLSQRVRRLGLKKVKYES